MIKNPTPRHLRPLFRRAPLPIRLAHELPLMNANDWLEISQAAEQLDGKAPDADIIIAAVWRFSKTLPAEQGDLLRSLLLDLCGV